ncbi:MAG: hypothetical protein PHG90_02355 [Clostridia bacterium]|nr:hypothetical protein [Clostridia bacterium]
MILTGGENHSLEAFINGKYKGHLKYKHEEDWAMLCSTFYDYTIY